ncbi:hypothetical protein DRH27_04460 [Candidatus Falkowbacteria bacterium]|nr:MAG: hypothetical protein DRH27_04460 [Candidatus Falkowbacteria bacterium]
MEAEKEVKRKPTYHQSRLSSFEFCGWADYLQNIEKKRGKGNFYSCQGSAVHASRKLNLRQKVKSHNDLTFDEIADACRDEVNRQFDEDKIGMNGDFISGKSKSAAAGFTIDKALRLARVDLRQLQSVIQPVEVEIKKEVALSNWEFDLGMTMDSRDDDEMITDCKTAKMRWSQARVDEAYQPPVYALGYKAHCNVYPKGFRYHCLTYTPKGKISAYELQTEISEQRIISMLNRFQAMHKAIKTGVFTPAHGSSWKCSPNWCDYYSQCKFVRK